MRLQRWWRKVLARRTLAAVVLQALQRGRAERIAMRTRKATVSAAVRLQVWLRAIAAKKKSAAGGTLVRLRFGMVDQCRSVSAPWWLRIVVIRACLVFPLNRIQHFPAKLREKNRFLSILAEPQTNLVR